MPMPRRKESYDTWFSSAIKSSYFLLTLLHILYDAPEIRGHWQTMKLMKAFGRANEYWFTYFRVQLRLVAIDRPVAYKSACFGDWLNIFHRILKSIKSTKINVLIVMVLCRIKEEGPCRLWLDRSFVFPSLFFYSLQTLSSAILRSASLLSMCFAFSCSLYCYYLPLYHHHRHYY